MYVYLKGIYFYAELRCISYIMYEKNMLNYKKTVGIFRLIK